MRLLRVRFTVRRLMVAVAAVSVVGSVAHSRSMSRVYRARSDMHYLARLRAEAVGDRPGADYHASMSAKYHRAYVFPWLHVEPDPPEPE